MNSNSIIAFIGALCCTGVGLAVLIRKPYSVAGFCFFLGMLILASESVLAGIASITFRPEEAASWLSLNLIAKSFVPGVWLFFSVVYSRGNYRELLAKSWLLVLAPFLLPI